MSYIKTHETGGPHSGGAPNWSAGDIINANDLQWIENGIGSAHEDLLNFELQFSSGLQTINKDVEHLHHYSYGDIYTFTSADPVPEGRPSKNLNDIKIPGEYVCTGGSVASALSNKPKDVTTGFKLVVQQMYGSNNLLQKLYTLNSYYIRTIYLTSNANEWVYTPWSPNLIKLNEIIDGISSSIDDFSSSSEEIFYRLGEVETVTNQTFEHLNTIEPIVNRFQNKDFNLLIPSATYNLLYEDQFLLYPEFNRDMTVSGHKAYLGEASKISNKKISIPNILNNTRYTFKVKIRPLYNNVTNNLFIRMFYNNTYSEVECQNTVNFQTYTITNPEETTFKYIIFYINSATDDNIWEIVDPMILQGPDYNEADYVPYVQASTLNLVDLYNTNHLYSSGEYCIYNNNLYKCIETINDTATWDESKWQRVQVMDSFDNFSSSLQSLEDTVGGLSSSIDSINDTLSDMSEWKGVVDDDLADLWDEVSVDKNDKFLSITSRNYNTDHTITATSSSQKTLNNYKVAGEYTCLASSIPYITNKPLGLTTSFKLVVTNFNYGIYQTIYSADGIFSRYGNATGTTTWQDWNTMIIPEPPSSTGIYQLICTVQDGTPTYTWMIPS